MFDETLSTEERGCVVLFRNSDSVVHNNTFDNNYYAITVYRGANDCNVSYNTFSRVWMGGIAWSLSSGNTYHSNTFYNLSYRALSISRCDNVTISYNMFDETLSTAERGCVVLFRNSDSVVHNNTFVRVPRGLELWGCVNTDVAHNTFIECDRGLTVRRAWPDIASKGTLVRYNNFLNCMEAANGTENRGNDVDYRMNWWGDVTGPSHANNTGGSGGPVTNGVTFEPWLERMVAPLLPIAVIVDLRPSFATEGDPVTFAGTALARNYTDLHVWRSSIDGEIYRGTSPFFSHSGLSNGTHTIYLKVRDSYGKWTEEVSTTLVINGRPRANILTLSPTLLNEGENVSFEGSFVDDKNEVNTFRWISNIDGFLSFRLAFSTDDLSNGTHVITFEVRDGHDVWSDAAVGQVTVNGLPRAWILKLEPTFINESRPVNFRGDAFDHEKDISGYQWLSDVDGDLSGEKMFSSSSLSNGTHTITFQAMDGYGEWSEPSTGTVTVNGIPIAIIESIGPDPANMGEFVNFRGGYIDDGDPIVSCEWESNIDGTLSFAKDFGTSELMPGNHIITFRVMDRYEVWSKMAMADLFVNQRPVASIDAIEPGSANEGELVRFSGSYIVRDNDIRESLWESDIDGVLSVLQEFSTTELSCGDHTISFKVLDGHGMWSEPAMAFVAVNGIPSASIRNISPSSANEGEAVMLTGEWTDFEEDVTEFSWTSDLDGPLSSSQEFSISKLSVGTHIISFRAMDGHGIWSEEATGTVIVNGIPKTSIVEIGPDPSFEGDPVVFSGTGLDDGVVSVFKWTSSIDGELGGYELFTRSDLSPGDHVITLRVQDDLGAWSEEVARTLEIKRQVIELEIVEIRFGIPVFEGEEVALEAVVSNIGLISVSDILVVFYDGDETIGKIPMDGSLEPDGLSAVELDWVPSLGNHAISVQLEHNGAVLVSREADVLLTVVPVVSDPPSNPPPVVERPLDAYKLTEPPLVYFVGVFMMVVMVLVVYAAISLKRSTSR
jgi:parallel beta-helix repeat protein